MHHKVIFIDSYRFLKPPDRQPVAMGVMDFVCPACKRINLRGEWLGSSVVADDFLLYKKCKGCKTQLGLALDIKGHVVAWLKSDDDKIEKQHGKKNKRAIRD